MSELFWSDCKRSHAVLCLTFLAAPLFRPLAHLSPVAVAIAFSSPTSIYRRPHVKYYNVAKYEAEKRAKAAAKQAKLYAEGKGKAPLRSALDDEQERERERRERIAKRKRDETYASLMALRSSDAAKNAMRENARLRATMTTAYKMGDMATYNKIKEQLEMTDEEAAKRNLNKEDQYLQGRRAV